LPRDFADRNKDVLTCGECAHFRAVEGLRGQCAHDGRFVAAHDRWCEWYDAP
jgi:hypothetical protein